MFPNTILGLRFLVGNHWLGLRFPRSPKGPVLNKIISQTVFEIEKGRKWENCHEKWEKIEFGYNTVKKLRI